MSPGLTIRIFYFLNFFLEQMKRTSLQKGPLQPTLCGQRSRVARLRLLDTSNTENYIIRANSEGARQGDNQNLSMSMSSGGLLFIYRMHVVLGSITGSLLIKRIFDWKRAICVIRDMNDVKVLNILVN